MSTNGHGASCYEVLTVPYQTGGKAASEEEITCFLSAHHYRGKGNTKRVLSKIRTYNQAIAPEVEKVLSQEAQLLRINRVVNTIE